MSEKKETRLRRARKARLKMRELETVRLSVYRSSQHIYAQVISADGAKVLASASTLDKELRGIDHGIAGGSHLFLLAGRKQGLGVGILPADVIPVVDVQRQRHHAAGPIGALARGTQPAVGGRATAAPFRRIEFQQGDAMFRAMCRAGRCRRNGCRCGTECQAAKQAVS